MRARAAHAQRHLSVYSSFCVMQDENEALLQQLLHQQMGIPLSLQIPTHYSPNLADADRCDLGIYGLEQAWHVMTNLLIDIDKQVAVLQEIGSW
jgi:hypothetical protein